MTQIYLPAPDQKRLQSLLSDITEWNKVMIGYPTATDFNYHELQPFFDFMLNNIGDPHVTSQYHLDTRQLECEVIDFFATLFRAPANEYWGYITNGGTESNMYALYLAREQYPDATVFYSAASHYSIKKSLHILRMNGVCVPAQPHGEIDYAALQEAMAEHAGTPAICIANIGTTMTEARDNVTNIRQAAAAAGVNDMFIHCDGALSSIPSALLPERHPFDFADGADSISFSGHKFLGAPFPCGAVIVRKKYKQHIGQAVAYIGTVDSTITGSRNGHGPLMLWYAIKRWGIEGLRQRTLQAHQMAAYTEKALQAINWECWRNPDAITVVIKTPPAAVADKWQLATADGWSHLICMPGMTRTMIDDFVRDVKAAA